MNIALILSGGTGTRLNADIPKQYIQVGGQSILSYSIHRLAAHPRIDCIQIVAAPAWWESIETWLGTTQWRKKFRGFSLPGENRQFSIYHGLTDLKSYGKDSDYVMIHDAARPMLSEAMITECLSAAQGHDGALPVLPMKDTVYFSEDGKQVSSLLNRSTVFAGQAPEVFRFGAYYEANRRLRQDQMLKINGSTEPAVMAGLDIVMIPGDEENFKITTDADLARFRTLIAERGLAEEEQ